MSLLLGAGLRASGSTPPRRTAPVYDPPVLAGQLVPGYCSAGFYARLGDTIVLTSSDHCAREGTVARDPATGIVNGVYGPSDRSPTCPYPGYTCAAADMNYLVVAADRIPWGHLNQLDLGAAGYRTIEPDTKPLSCSEIAVGDAVETNGRAVYRSGTVREKGRNLFPIAQDGDYFPCMIAADVEVATGDSGAAVLVRGVPAGVISRSYGGLLGFTPLAEGLAEMGLVLCTTRNCDLVPPPPAGSD